MDRRDCLPETASQTAGPYLHIGLYPSAAGLPIRTQARPNVVAGPKIAGDRIRIEGLVLDGTGSIVRDAMVELWQADAHGRYHHPADARDLPEVAGFRGWGRAVTDFQTGFWWFETMKPGRVPGRQGQGLMAPHVSLWIAARGINMGLHTRLYFADEAAANEADPVLRLIEQPVRRQTLIAERRERDGEVVYRFDIRLQGERETVFFDV